MTASGRTLLLEMQKHMLWQKSYVIVSMTPIRSDAVDKALVIFNSPHKIHQLTYHTTEKKTKSFLDIPFIHKKNIETAVTQNQRTKIYIR